MKITELPSTSSISNDDFFVMVDNADNTTKKATQAQVTNSILPQDLTSTGTPTFNSVTVKDAKLGGDTNYLKITEGGKLQAVGTATWFDDLRVEPTVRGSGTKVPSYAVMIGGIYAYEFDNAVLASEKEVNFKMQLPHGWKQGSPLALHLHWVAKTTGSAGEKVRWGFEYTRANINGVLGATTTVYATDAANPPSTTPTAMTQYLTPFTPIDMTGGTLSTMILGRIFRNSSDAADTYTDSVYLVAIDAHYEAEALGSNDEYA